MTSSRLAKRVYENEYELGYLVDGDSNWESMDAEDRPSWARRAQAA